MYPCLEIEVMFVMGSPSFWHILLQLDGRNWSASSAGLHRIFASHDFAPVISKMGILPRNM